MLILIINMQLLFSLLLSTFHTLKLFSESNLSSPEVICLHDVTNHSNHPNTLTEHHQCLHNTTTLCCCDKDKRAAVMELW